jgi:menaquinone-dependent protoporphyrinogen IX oxidase
MPNKISNNFTVIRMAKSEVSYIYFKFEDEAGFKICLDIAKTFRNDGIIKEALEAKSGDYNVLIIAKTILADSLEREISRYVNRKLEAVQAALAAYDQVAEKYQAELDDEVNTKLKELLKLMGEQ